MNTPIWNFSIPILVLFVVAESWYDHRQQMHLYDKRNTWCNVMVGLLAISGNLLGKTLALAVYELIYSVHLFHPENGWLYLGLCLLATDFSCYWNHRAGHRINWFWTTHYVHHTSEKYNLTVSFRNSFTSLVSGQLLFWAWLPWVGFHPVLVLLMYELCVLYQFWLHTELIRKLPRWFEFVFNTPSHHRVHHGSNEKYLDTNYASIFILWDRIFGTFQAEEEAPTYGLTKPLGTEHPFWLSVKPWKNLWKQVKSAGSLREAAGIIFHAPGESEGSTVQCSTVEKPALPAARGKKSFPLYHQGNEQILYRYAHK